MGYLIFTLIIITCIAIIGIVLIQNPKGGGVSSSFGALNQISGVKQTSEGVEKVTWGLAIFLVVLCLAATPFMKGGTTKQVANPESSVQMNSLPSQAQPMQAPANGNPAKTR